MEKSIKVGFLSPKALNFGPNLNKLMAFGEPFSFPDETLLVIQKNYSIEWPCQPIIG